MAEPAFDRSAPFTHDGPMAAPIGEPARSAWIFGGRGGADFAWLFLPGLLTIVACAVIRDNVPNSLLFGSFFFFASSFAGSGHIYTTAWRTYFHGPERGRSRMYLWIPLICFSLLFSWRFFALSWIAYIGAYSAMWHHVRQSFGIQKWYQRQNRRFRKGSDFFTMALCSWPFLLFHFREPTDLKFVMLPGDVLLSPNPAMFRAGLAIYAVGVASWLVYELRLRREREWNRVAFVGFSIFLHGFCLLLGRNAIEILFPINVYHGFGYFGLVAGSMTKIKPRVFTFGRAVFAVAVTALVFGTYERVIEYNPNRFSLFWSSVWVGVFITPILSHYAFDAFLWRRNHPDAKLIYADGPSLVVDPADREFSNRDVRTPFAQPIDS